MEMVERMCNETHKGTNQFLHEIALLLQKLD